jgi:hypothetical protein
MKATAKLLFGKNRRTVNASAGNGRSAAFVGGVLSEIGITLNLDGKEYQITFDMKSQADRDICAHVTDAFARFEGPSVDEVLKATPIHHPSSIWEWYKEGKRHPGGGKAFVSFPDFKKALQKLKGVR